MHDDFMGPRQECTLFFFEMWATIRVHLGTSILHFTIYMLSLLLTKSQHLGAASTFNHTGFDTSCWSSSRFANLRGTEMNLLCIQYQGSLGRCGSELVVFLPAHCGTNDCTCLTLIVRGLRHGTMGDQWELSAASHEPA